MKSFLFKTTYISGFFYAKRNPELSLGQTRDTISGGVLIFILKEV